MSAPLSDTALAILGDSDAVCDFQEESNGDICGRDPRIESLCGGLDDWFFDMIQTPDGGIAIVRCPDHF